MAIFLGVDGGGTGCRAVVADAAGRILGRGEAGPSNIVTDPEEARDNILAAASAALAGHGALTDLHAALGLAGANLPEYAARIAGLLPFATVRVECDAVTALKGALEAEDGTCVTIGTGSVFAGQRGGEVTVIGGWGLNLGDEAGGAWLGRALLSRALQAGDGLVPMTPLLSRVLAGAGGAAALVDFARTARPVDYARHARTLVAAAGTADGAPDPVPTSDAAAPDPAATAILAEADGWILRAIHRLDPEAAGAVCFLGGLGPLFSRRLASRLGARLRPARGTALDGALLLARQGG